MYTTLPSSARNTAPAPAIPGLPFDEPSNSRIQEFCIQKLSSCLANVATYSFIFVSERHYYEWFYLYVASVQVPTHFKKWLDLITILIDQTKMKTNLASWMWWAPPRNINRYVPQRINYTRCIRTSTHTF